MSERVAYRSLLNFLLLFLSREKVKKEKYEAFIKTKKNIMNKIKKVINTFLNKIIFSLFFCLDAKEPKNQDKPEGSARFVLPAPPSV